MRHGGYVYWDSDRTVDVDSYNQRSRVSQRRQGGGGGGGGEAVVIRQVTFIYVSGCIRYSGNESMPVMPPSDFQN